MQEYKRDLSREGITGWSCSRLIPCLLTLYLHPMHDYPLRRMVVMVKQGVPYGESSLYLAPGVAFINEEEAVFAAMVEGWTDAQVGGRLNKRQSADSNVARAVALQEFTNEFPWNWTAGMFDEWMMHLISERKLMRSTLRVYQASIRAFCNYLISDHYTWAQQCEQRFGTHPTQIVHEWNSARHILDYEGRPGRRPLARDEVQRLFDHIDSSVDSRLDQHKKGALQVYRDATIMKVIYGWGLRADEVANLEVTDFYRNPHAPEFGDYGILQVQFGKGSHGSGKKRRSVLTLRAGAVAALKAYVDEVWPTVRMSGSNLLWVTERGNRLQAKEITERFAVYRDEIRLDSVLSPHCLRHSYATHLAEEGFDPRFIQEQMGHQWGTTTGIYTHVTGNFMNTMMRQALEKNQQARPTKGPGK
ncbi:tyrosine-type recombinase/integrase [Brevibacterium aurantiacum]|uniref:tyrosine-type recombinase/integrase n=2 Tax=Brevibacterium TaxID=1696 RepID=UPI001D026CB5|nr:tyrosine-type recombinase/integrase [Brevibacterium aurantiacum]